MRLGEHTLSTTLDCQFPDRENNQQNICAEPVQDFDIEKVIFHPSYNSPNVFQNDVALMRLSRDIVINGKYYLLQTH